MTCLACGVELPPRWWHRLVKPTALCSARNYVACRRAQGYPELVSA